MPIGGPDRFGRPSALPDTSRLPSRTAPGSAPPQGPGGPPSIQQLGGSIQIPPWYLVEYPSAQDWNIQSLNFTATGSTTTTVPSFSYTVPAQNVSVIKFVKWDIQTVLNTTNLTLTLRRNGAPIPGWAGIACDPIAATGIILPFNDLVVRLAQGDVVTASVTEGAGTTYTCSLHMQGWHVPWTEVQRLSNGINL